MSKLLSVYDEEFIQVLRQQLLSVFINFEGGFPLFLNYMIKTVSTKGKHLPVSPTQIQAYKTVQNFLKKGLSPSQENVRFYHAFLLIEAPERARRCQNANSDIRRAELIWNEQFKHFKGKSRYGFKEELVNTFRYTSLGTPDGLFTNPRRRLFSMTEEIEASILKNAINKREFWFIIESLGDKRFSKAHIVQVDRDALFDRLSLIDGEAKVTIGEFEPFLERAKLEGMKTALKGINWNSIIFNIVTGPIFWNGLSFFGTLTRKSDGMKIEVSGNNFVPHAPCWTEIDWNNEYDQLYPEDVSSEDVYTKFFKNKNFPIIDTIGFRFFSHKNGVTEEVGFESASTYDPILPPSCELISTIADPLNTMPKGAEMHLQRDALTTNVTLIKCGGASRSSDAKKIPSTRSRQISLLLRAYFRYNMGT